MAESRVVSDADPLGRDIAGEKRELYFTELDLPAKRGRNLGFKLRPELVCI
jgi:hypothetical protein